MKKSENSMKNSGKIFNDSPIDPETIWNVNVMVDPTFKDEYIPVSVITIA